MINSTSKGGTVGMGRIGSIRLQMQPSINVRKARPVRACITHTLSLYLFLEALSYLSLQFMLHKVNEHDTFVSVEALLPGFHYHQLTPPFTPTVILLVLTEVC